MKKMLAIFACACCGLVEAATYYKVGNDPANSSSFAGNVSSTVGWSTTKGATTTTTVSDMANSDFIIDSPILMRTPAADTAVTFPDVRSRSPVTARSPSRRRAMAVTDM